MKPVYPYTPWGKKVNEFCVEYGLSKRDLSALTGIPYDTIMAVSKGLRAGHKAKPIIDTFMESYKPSAEWVERQCMAR